MFFVTSEMPSVWLDALRFGRFDDALFGFMEEGGRVLVKHGKLIAIALKCMFQLRASAVVHLACSYEAVHVFYG